MILALLSSPFVLFLIGLTIGGIIVAIFHERI